MTRVGAGAVEKVDNTRFYEVVVDAENGKDPRCGNGILAVRC